MMPVAQSATGGAGSFGPYSMSPNPTSPPHMFWWTATARTFGGAGAVGLRGQRASRSSTSCFMRGLAETVTLETNNDLSWEWRRICFTFKGGNNFWTTFNGGTSGYARQLLNIGQSSNPVDVTKVQQLNDLMFQGNRNVDWYNPMDAPIDTTRVTLKYDRKRIISSKGTAAYKTQNKMWHPMNKYIVYDDEESANSENTVAYSVQDKRGMGDYHVIDMFQSVGPGVTGTLEFAAQASLYWHEK